MKIKIISLLLLLISLSGIAYSQTSVQDDVNYNDLYLTISNHTIKFSDLSPTNMTSLIGKPIKKTSKKSKASSNIVVSYIYAGGSIDFEKDLLSFIELKNKDWAFTFKKESAFTPHYTIGTEAVEIKNEFPYTLLKKGENFINIPVTTATDENIVGNVLFEIKNKKVNSASFYTGEL